MKQLTTLARMMRGLFLLILTVGGCRSAQAQNITPTVCVDAPYRTGSATLAAAAAIGDTSIQVNGYVPPLVALTINPGGANQETVAYVGINITGNNPYTLPMSTFFYSAAGDNGNNNYALAKAHAAGETVTFAGYSGTAYFGYINPGAQAANIRPAVPQNYFAPGQPIRNQPADFLPGIYSNVFSIPFGGQVSNPSASNAFTWTVLGQSVAVRNAAANECAVITYQGRLSNAGAAATGSYDLQFTVFDALTGGTAQTGKITMSNVAVAGGIFTVPINFGSTLRGNSPARFLEIAVKPSANTSDSFTVLAPRQPLTAAPFAVNAQKAFDVQMVLTNGAPSASDCDSSSKYGQTRVDAASLKLYVCTAAGWKSATLQ